MQIWGSNSGYQFVCKTLSKDIFLNESVIGTKLNNFIND